MFILTKRTAPSDRGNVMHSIHGFTENVSVARAWYRATRTTDVVYLSDVGTRHFPQDWLGQCASELISLLRIESWREQQLRQELEQAALRTDLT